MASLSISFNDEYPGMTTFRNKFINVLNSILKEEAEIFGSNITITLTSIKNNRYQFKYNSGRHQTPVVNELDICSNYLTSVNRNYPIPIKIETPNEKPG